MVTMERACIVFVCVIAAALGSPATQWPCTEATRCTVSNVDITPCAKPSLCQFKRGRNASINFEIQPQFSATELQAEVSYNRVAFEGLDRDACKYTTCPTTQGAAQPVSYSLYLEKKLPKGKYMIKWKVWNKADSDDLCCFLTHIQITP